MATRTNAGSIARKLRFRITTLGIVRELIVGCLIVFILQGSAERRKRFIRKIDNSINLPIPTAIFDQIDGI